MRSRAFYLIGFSLFQVASTMAAPDIIVRNHHDLDYAGPVTFPASLEPGQQAHGVVVEDGLARVEVNVPAGGEYHVGSGAAASDVKSLYDFEVTPGGFLFKSKTSAERGLKVEFGLVSLPSSAPGTEAIAVAFSPFDFIWKGEQAGFEVDYRMPSGVLNCVDTSVKLTKLDATPASDYLALVMKVTQSGMQNFTRRWDGLIVSQSDLTPMMDKPMKAGQGLDWCAWSNGQHAFSVINAFAPGYGATRDPGFWSTVGTYNKGRQVFRSNDALYFITELSPPVVKSRKEKKLLPPPPYKGDTFELRQRLAVTAAPEVETDWVESQFRVFSGFWQANQIEKDIVVDLGAPSVEFGTSYFPYSTLTENFDYYRTPGVLNEGWWSISPPMWTNWRDFIPRMKTDMWMIRAQGFSWIRPHHLWLTKKIGPSERAAFIDFYMNQCRKLGLKVMVDSASIVEDLAPQAERYQDVVKSFELDNEQLIFSIKDFLAERWKASYEGIKEVSSDVRVHLTGNGNTGAFEGLKAFDIPFDNTGLHYYKHGPDRMREVDSVVTGFGGYGSHIGKPAVLSEFNWKRLTRFSPERRLEVVSELYANMLKPRALPEFYQFHWQETLSANPRMTRWGIRHYEAMYLDRRPKPEALALFALMRKYAAPDEPFKELPVTIGRTAFENGTAVASFLVENRSAQTTRIQLSPECFEAEVKLLSKAELTLAPGEQAEGKIQISLPPEKFKGTYHYFLRASYELNGREKTNIGWGYASNVGAPAFSEASLLPERVEYTGWEDIHCTDWSRPTCVVFDEDCSVNELEMAYQVFNTLQSATGAELHLSSTKDMPADAAERWNVIRVGAQACADAIRKAGRPFAEDKGHVVVTRHESGATSILLYGLETAQSGAAASDFTLRYWPQAKDASIRITGMDKGAALGNAADPGVVDLP